MTQISHNPFARTSLLREIVQPSGQTCSWCGGLNRRGKLFKYSTLHDGIATRPAVHRGEFCSKSCHDSYHH